MKLKRLANKRFEDLGFWGAIAFYIYRGTRQEPTNRVEAGETPASTRLCRTVSNKICLWNRTNLVQAYQYTAEDTQGFLHSH